MATVLKAGAIKIDLEANAKNLISGFKEALGSLSSFGKGTEKTTSQAKKLDDQLKALERRKELLANKMKILEGAGKTSTDMYRNLGVQVANTSDRIATQNIKIDEFKSKTSSSNGVLSSMIGAFSSLANIIKTGFVVALTSATATIGVLTTMGFGLAISYEQQMSNIKALTGANNEQIKSLDKLALEMGSKTKYSALEAAQGIEELLKAGVSLEQVINGGLAGALDLASAGGVSVADSAEIASTALNAFRKDGLKVAQVADILAGAANTSATNIDSLRLGLGQVSAVASGIGMTFNDTSTALAVFAQNGLKGSDAGTSLKTMLLNLQPGSKKQRALFDELGLTVNGLNNKFFDAQGKTKSLADISEVLKTKLGKLTDQQRSLALEQLFGTDATRAANILFKEGAKGVTDMQVAMSNVTAQEVAREKTNNLAGALERLKSAFDTKLIQIFTKPLPGMAIAINVVTNAIENLDFAKIKQDLVSLGEIFNKVRESIVNTAIAVLTYFKPEIDGLKNIFQIFTTQILPPLINWFGIIAGVLIWVGSNVLVALMYAWEQLREPMMQLMTSLFELRGAISPIITVILALVGVLIAGLMPVLQIVWAYLVQVFSGLVQILSGVIKFISGLFNIFIGIFEAIFTGDTTRIMNGFRQLWQGLVQFMGGLWTLMKAPFVAIGDGIMNTLKAINLMQVGKDMIEGLIKGISGMASKVGEEVKKLGNLVPDQLKNVLGIKSPSRVLMQVGMDAGEGLEIGLADMQPNIEAQVVGMSNLIAGVLPQDGKPSNTTINKQRNVTIHNYDSSRDSRFINFSTAFA